MQAGDRMPGEEGPMTEQSHTVPCLHSGIRARYTLDNHRSREDMQHGEIRLDT